MVYTFGVLPTNLIKNRNTSKQSCKNTWRRQIYGPCYIKLELELCRDDRFLTRVDFIERYYYGKGIQKSNETVIIFSVCSKYDFEKHAVSNSYYYFNNVFLNSCMVVQNIKMILPSKSLIVLISELGPKLKKKSNFSITVTSENISWEP